MNSYELISPLTNEPCGVHVCGVCSRVTPKECVDKCCQPCACGKPPRNRFACKCSDCVKAEQEARMKDNLKAAELVEWDGEAMIFSDDVMGYNDGWFASPEDLREYMYDEEIDDGPEFAFIGRKCVSKLDIHRAIDRMLEDTSGDSDLDVTPEDQAALQAAVDAFNEKYAVTYYRKDYKRKVRVKT